MSYYLDKVSFNFNSKTKKILLKQEYKNEFKFTVLGNSAVGKTSLIYRFMNANLPQEYEPTFEDRFKTTLKIKERNYELEILDTAGEDYYQNMFDQWISFGEGFLLVFAINDKKSFDSIKEIYNRLKRRTEIYLHKLILVGNKKDLENERKVTYSEAKSQADEWNIEYIETSTKTDFNCKKAFENLARTIFRSRYKGRGSTCIII